ncbi:hypothetical protein PVA45_04095 [Entomospira entomophila]|uniref:Tetratricopeptide repeat protein n=1 Tax=Entomospira entomophila TaxID=2719988 RepID=A0A968GAA3_9SPIO|nr:hypothetical protein [Entomospira entomophilus]NIZ40690.1 hypothetical protein [Entomospira entomophilus]WDI34903.1 hypothetical protein PVA45_04095 [Entomospira entomophilus]
MRDAPIKLGYFLLVLLVLYGVWSFFFRIMGNHNINELLRYTDIAISQSEYRQAQQYLKSINRRGLSAYDRLRILARIFEIGNHTNDFTYLEKESQQAMNAYKDREDFKAFHVFALLENHKIKTAGSIAEKSLHDLRFKDIRSRAILSNLFSNSDNPFNTAEQELLTRMDASFYLEIAKLLNEPILYFNATLLLLREGNKEQARSILPFFISSHDISVTRRAIIAYELEFYDQAFDLLNTLPPAQLQNIESILLLADLHLKRDNSIVALELYRTALSLDPLYSSTPWLNVALLTEQFYADSQNSVRTTLQQGLNQFSDDYRLLIALGQRLPNKQDAITELTSFMQKFPNNAYVYLFWLNEFTAENQLETISSKLWDLFNYDPYNDVLARYMIWFLLGQKNFSDAELIIERFKGDNTAWIIEYQALILALNEDFTEAGYLITQAEASWENLYNQAIIMSMNYHLESAIQSLISAAALYRGMHPSQFSAREFAMIQAKLSEMYLLDNRYALAETAAQEALRHDPDNALALQILQRLSRIK